MTTKSKGLCAGCREDYYNQTKPGGCWLYKEAKVVTRYRIGWWVQPATPGAFTKVKMLECYSRPGEFGHYKELPDFAVDVQDATVAP